MDFIIEKPHDWLWVLEQLRTKKLVRNPNWGTDLYIYKKGDRVVYNKDEKQYTSIYGMNLTNWEIYEEPKKTLYEIADGVGHIALIDVKEALKDFIKEIQRDVTWDSEGDVYDIAKRIFGEKLL